MKKLLKKVYFIGLVWGVAFLFLRTSSTDVSSRPPVMVVPPRASVAVAVPTEVDFVEVKRVIDGDTIDVVENGKIVRVRLIGINAPESVDPRKPVECFGLEASKRLKETLPQGTAVRLLGDSSQGAQDKYGRTLAYVFLSDGTDINELMVTEGFAREYTYRKPYKFQKEFKEAQASARGAGRGLFAPGACI